MSELWASADAVPAALYHRRLDQVEARMADFAGLALKVDDWSVPVQACPGWDVYELVVHTGMIHQWVLAALDASDNPPSPPRPGTGGQPLADPADWYARQAAALVAALRARDPQDLAWTLWGPPVSSFWARRQFHEVSVHCYDLDQTLVAQGHQPSWQIDDEAALDGIREAVEGFHPRAVRLGRGTALPGLVRFAARISGRDEPSVVWTSRLMASESTALLGEIAGTAGELYLAVWNRQPFPVGTDEALTALLRSARLVP